MGPTDADISKHEGFIRRFADYLFPEWSQGPGREDYEDVCQEGRLGICEAFQSHTENGYSGTPVDSYILDYVKARMLDAFRSLTQTCAADEVSLDSLMGWAKGDGGGEEGPWEPASHHDTEAEALANLDRAGLRQHLTQRESDALAVDVSRGTPRNSADERAARRARAKIRRTRAPQRTQAVR